MSYADRIFKENCREILTHGVWDTDQNVRPHWEDGTPAHTVKKFGIVNRYDLRQEFPILTIRRTYFKTCIDELLWIWQQKSNNIHDLRGHIWDSWADESGSIGKAYGYQLAVKHQYPEGEMDQVDRVLYDLKHFKALTSGHTVLMGRKTLQSLPGGRGLPGRRNLVLTSERAFTAENAQVVHSVEDAVRAAGEDAWVIGGESVYRQLLPLCRRVFVTRIAADGGADAFFPPLEDDPRWHLAARSAPMEENGLTFRYEEYTPQTDTPRRRKGIKTQK